MIGSARGRRLCNRGKCKRALNGINPRDVRRHRTPVGEDPPDSAMVRRANEDSVSSVGAMAIACACRGSNATHGKASSVAHASTRSSEAQPGPTA